MESEHQIPIWFFIGALLALYGVLIFGTGVYGLFDPPNPPKVELAHLHVDVWWGLLMIALGAFYCVRFHPFRRRP